jgi:hypothetical protein
MAIQRKESKFTEADLVDLFGLKKLVGNEKTALMSAWTKAETTLNEFEAYQFERKFQKAQGNIEWWHEEDLKMKFIAFVLDIAYMEDDTENYISYFEKTVSATVENTFLKVKTDFMVANGVMDKPKKPYFHFQEYKKLRDPNGDPVAQLVEAFLIAQELNKNGKPVYGCTVTGKYWEFFIMEGKTYCLSKSYDCMEREDLMKIIAMLREFKVILEKTLIG